MDEYKVVCITNEEWGYTDGELNERPYNPKKGDILTVVWEEKENGKIFYYFREIPNIGEDGTREAYDSEEFRRLVPQNFTNELTKELANQGIVREGIERIVTRELINS